MKASALQASTLKSSASRSLSARSSRPRCFAGGAPFLRVAAACAALTLLPVTSGMAAPFRDAANRTVELSGKVERIIPAGPPAQVLLYALAPEKLAGLVEAFPPAGRVFVPQAYRNLERIPRLSHTPKPEDMEKLRQLKADLVVDYGNTGPSYVAAINKAQADLGTPAILLDGSLAATPRNLRALGTLIGVPERGEKLAAAAQDVLDKLAPLAALPNEARPSVYLARGSDGLNAARPGTSLSEAITLAGGRNATPPGSGAFVRTTVEEVVALAPDVVVFEDQAALKSPLRAALPAKTRVYVDEAAPFGSLESPPSLNRLVGAAALAKILHPDRAPADPDYPAKIRETFFGPVPPGLTFTPLLTN